jgi:hypothetical protein
MGRNAKESPKARTMIKQNDKVVYIRIVPGLLTSQQTNKAD